MAITKILKINNLDASVNYCCRDDKTEQGKYITTHDCTLKNYRNEFDFVTNKRKKFIALFKIKQRMLIQNFGSDDITPEKAHELGLELAHRYLGDDIQFILTTHTDSGLIHNHIIFNCTNEKTGKPFDARRKHFIYDLRDINDKICIENGFTTIENPKESGISQKEYYARKANRSYKGKLQNAIDEAVKSSASYDIFIEKMSADYDIFDKGKYLTFKEKNGEQKNSIRSKTLGTDYSEMAIRFRIDNPEIEIIRKPRFSKLINTAEERYQGRENRGLKNWATRQNIKVLAAALSEIGAEKKRQQEGEENPAPEQPQENTFNATNETIIDRASRLRIEMREQGQKVEILTEQIQEQQSLYNSCLVYKNFYPTMVQYKKCPTPDAKKEFKSKHYKEFKTYDQAKKILDKNKTEQGKYPNIDKVKKKLDTMKEEYSDAYSNYQDAKLEASKLSSVGNMTPDITRATKKEK